MQINRKVKRLHFENIRKEIEAAVEKLPNTVYMLLPMEKCCRCLRCPEIIADDINGAILKTIEEMKDKTRSLPLHPSR